MTINFRELVQFKPSNETLDQIEQAQQKIFSLLIREGLGENYTGYSYEIWVVQILSNDCKTIPAKAFMYTYLKGREDQGLQIAARVWQKMNVKDYKLVRIHIVLFVAYCEALGLFKRVFGGIDLNPLH